MNIENFHDSPTDGSHMLSLVIYYFFMYFYMILYMFASRTLTTLRYKCVLTWLEVSYSIPETC
jgi:hypothetical protein